MATGPRKTAKTAAPVVEAPERAPVAEPVTVAAPAETVEPAAKVEPVPAAEPAKIVAEVAKVQQAAKQAGADTAHALEDSFTSASKSLQAFSAKAMEAYQANAAASVNYLQALSSVRSVSEAIALQSDHMRKQYESLTAQAKELTALAQQVAADAAGPLKEQLGKAFKPK